MSMIKDRLLRKYMILTTVPHKINKSLIVLIPFLTDEIGIKT